MGKRGPERTYTRDAVYDVLETGHDDPYEPWTTSEVAAELGCDKSVAYNRLDELEELGEIKVKSMPMNANVWWIGAEKRNE